MSTPVCLPDQQHQEMENQSRLFNITLIGTLITFLAAVVWYYSPVLGGLWRQLTQNEDNSYGLILPLVAVYIVYRKWPIIKGQLWRPSWWGLIIIGAGLMVYLLGELWADLLTARLSFIIVLSGMACLVGGKRLMRELLFPLFLIALMFPMPLLVTRQLSLPLQLISSKLAAWFLSALGYPVFLKGNIIDLGERQLQVVAACSGLRYLINLLSLGIIFSYFFQRRPWKIGMLLASLIPFTIVANALRLASIGIFPILEKGWWHTSIGLSIFLLGFDYLKGINWLLNKISGASDITLKEKTDRPGGGGRMSRKRSLLPAISAVVLVLLGGMTIQSLAKVQPVPLLQGLENFPLRLGLWQGKLVPVDQRVISSLQVDGHLSIEYASPGKGPVSLWVAYYANVSMAGGIHSPMLCLTSSGWHLQESGVVEVIPGKSVKYMVMHEPDQDVLVNYWYIQGNRWLTNLYYYKFHMIFDKLWNRRSDAALVRIITPLQPDKDRAQARLKEFVGLIGPVLPEFIAD